MTKKKKLRIIIGSVLFAIFVAAAVILSIKFDLWGQKADGPYDISISTQAGFTADKVEEIRTLDGVSRFVGVCEQITDSCIIQSFPEDVITPELVEGRQVQTENEVVVDARYAAQKKLQLGQKIPLTIGEDTAPYTIVGIATPCFDMQSPAKPFFFVDLSAFHTDGFNRIYLCVSRHASISSVQKEINDLGYLGQKYRYEQLRREVQSKINETKKLMDTILGPMEEELSEAKVKLDAAERELDLSGNTQKLSEAEARLQSAKAELDSGREELDRIKESLDAVQEELDAQRQQLRQRMADFDAALKQAGVSAEEIETRLAQLQEELGEDPENEETLQMIEVIRNLQTFHETVDSYRREFEKADARYEKDSQTYHFGEYGYQAFEEEYEANLAEFEEQKAAFEAGKAAFYAKQAEYRQAEQEYLNQKREYEQQIETYQQELDAIQPADWTVSRFGQDGTLLPIENVKFA